MATASIKILKDGKVVAAYASPLPAALRMTEKSGKEILMIRLDDADNT